MITSSHTKLLFESMYYQYFYIAGSVQDIFMVSGCPCMNYCYRYFVFLCFLPNKINFQLNKFFLINHVVLNLQHIMCYVDVLAVFI